MRKGIGSRRQAVICQSSIRRPAAVSHHSKRKDKERDRGGFLLADEEGRPAETGHALKPSAETLLHTYVYQHTNAGCCLHVHTVDNNVISELYAKEKQVTFRGQEIIKALGLWEEHAEVTVPIIETALIFLIWRRICRAPFRRFRRSADSQPRHYCLGKTAFEAKRMLEAYEFLFSWHLKLKALQAYHV
ncbi:class II aldolase/adducin family protein [Bacillus licheniformis]|nr:class II aldolase/adducin family protein [Bacillus licheniformis]